jgi:hypothetical protein
MNLARSEKLLYRLFLYLQRQWMPEERHDQRQVYSLVGAAMSFHRAAFREVSFDERFRFGAEDLDVCLQLRRYFPDTRLIVTPDAIVKHHFVPSLRDTLRRSRAYGRGTARLYRKWPSMRPTIFPGPPLVLALLVASVFFPILLVAAVMLPQLMYPRGLQLAAARRRPACALDAYVTLAEETLLNVGYLQGLWQCRHLVPEPVSPAAQPRNTRGKSPVGPSA